MTDLHDKEKGKTAKQEEIVVVSVHKDKYGWDFGHFPSDYKILEHKSLWLKYLNARYELEILESRLIKIAEKKYKTLKHL